jgi:hypothetical protein
MTGTAAVCMRIALVSLAVAGTPAIAIAQDAKYFVYFEPGNQSDREPKSQIYAGGVGLERSLERHLAVQVDVAALSYYNADLSRTLGGIASFDAVGNFWVGQRYEMFGAGGYSVVFAQDATNLFNLGGGVRHWFREDRGVLVEYRYRQGNGDALLNKFWSVRLGLVFR